MAGNFLRLRAAAPRRAGAPLPRALDPLPMRISPAAAARGVARQRSGGVVAAADLLGLARIDAAAPARAGHRQGDGGAAARVAWMLAAVGGLRAAGGGRI